MNRITRATWRRTAPIALSLGALAAAASLYTPAPPLAAGNTLSVTPVTVNGSTGGTFTIHVVGNSSVPVAGTSASVVFDSTKLHVTDLAKGADWTSNGASWAGYPSTANKATFIANANSAGKVPAIGAVFTDGSSTLAASTDHDLYTVTFQVTACGQSTISLPVGAADGGMLDGNVATYGASLTVTSSGATVTVPCASPSPSATASASASATPSASTAATPTPSSGTQGEAATPPPTSTTSNEGSAGVDLRTIALLFGGVGAALLVTRAAEPKQRRR